MFEKKAHREDSVMACLREGPICACDCIGECRCNTASTGMTKSWQLEPRLIQLLKA